MSNNKLLILIILALLATVAFFTFGNGGVRPVSSSISEAVIMINEVMPVNQSVLVDMDGDCSDWVELYNASNQSVRLAGYGLSDDPSKPGKWLFPDITIPSKGYLVIFTSGKSKTSSNELHTGFRIKAKGEKLVLTDPQGEVVDSVEVPACESNISYGRSAEKLSEWVHLPLPSPGFPNTEKGASDFEATRWIESPIRISEVMADNISVLQNTDGEYADWIEIANTGNADVDLTGYALSNDKNDLFQWRFPKLNLKPGQSVVVFCTGRNRNEQGSELHASFKINRSSDQIYLVNPVGKILDFAVIDRLPGDMSLVQNASGDWEVSDKPTPGYANSAEGYEEYLQATQKQPALAIWEVMPKNAGIIADESGNFNDWVEIRNLGSTAVNLESYYLSDDGDDIRKWRFPSLQLPPGGYALVFLSSEYDKPMGDKYPHASFALSASGDVLYLSDEKGTILQKLVVPAMTTDISYGCVDGNLGFSFFAVPTPGRANDPDSRLEAYALEPVFSVNGGFFSSPLTLTVTTPETGAVIYYTTDGSEPGPSSSVLSQALQIEKTTVVRAVAYKKGALPSSIVTNTYILDPQNRMAVVSICTNPENLWSDETGIYALGHPYEDVYPFHGANFWQEWERPAHIEFFEPDGSLGFTMDAGISIRGEYTQALDQKSFGIDARKKYGSEYIHYEVFPNRTYTHYQSIVLRNSGQDNTNSKLRDVLASQLMKETGLDYQEYRPAVLYLNGEYWGFYTLRESTDKHFLHANHPEINMDNLDIIEGDWRVHKGDMTEYRAMINFIKNNDLTVAENYNYVKSKMDIDNYIDYQIAVIYGANVDNGNIKYWRERTEDAKWRWILYDFDMAFRYPEHDTVSDVFNPEGTGSDNLFSTDLQMGLLQNQDFRDQFLRRFAYHMKTTFEPQRVCDLIDKLAAEIEPEIERNYTKWKGSMNTWRSCITKMKDFFVKRPEFARRYIQQYFQLSDSQMREYGF